MVTDPKHRSAAGTQREFHVYDNRMTEVGGKAVMGGKVLLSEKEAEYYIEQGVIGEEPRKERSRTAQHATGQMTGRGPVTMSEEAQKEAAKEAEGTKAGTKRKS